MTTHQISKGYVRTQLRCLDFLRELYARTIRKTPLDMDDLRGRYRLPPALTRLLIKEKLITREINYGREISNVPFCYWWNTILPNVHMALKLMEIVKKQREEKSQRRKTKVLRVNCTVFTTHRKPLSCMNCQKPFLRVRKDAKYCCENCKARYNKKRKKLKRASWLSRFLSKLWDFVMN